MSYASTPIDFTNGLSMNGNNLSFYVSHLRRFVRETSLLPISDALMQGDVEQAFLLVHTLKGLSAQLAIVSVCEPAAVLCDLLRGGSAENLPQAQDAFLTLLAGFEEARDMIERY